MTLDYRGRPVPEQYDDDDFEREQERDAWQRAESARPASRAISDTMPDTRLGAALDSAGIHSIEIGPCRVMPGQWVAIMRDSDGSDTRWIARADDPRVALDRLLRGVGR